LLDQAKHAGGPGWDAGMIARQSAGLMFASLTSDTDPLVAANAMDILWRYDVIELDQELARLHQREAARLAGPTKAAADPDPAVRAKAVIDAGQGIGGEEIVFHALDDADASVRLAALRVFDDLLDRSVASPSTPMALMRVQTIAASDSSNEVRAAAASALAMLRSEKFFMYMPRLRLMSRSAKEADRVAAATFLGFTVDRNQPVARGPGQPERSDYQLLVRLLDDPAAAVRSAAGVSLVRYVRRDESQAPAAKEVVKRLANPAALEPDAKAAMLNVVPWLAGANVAGLVDHADDDVKTAALLGVEQPAESRGPVPPIAGKRVPVAVAAKALLSPARRVRRMAAHTLMYPDPADPTRQTQGATALLAASNDPRDPVAIDALDMLIDVFASGRMQPQWIMYTDEPATQFDPTRNPAPPSKGEQQMIDKALGTGSATIAVRLAAINQMGAAGPALLDRRWEVLLRLLTDADPQIRAAAFAMARSGVTQAVRDRLPAGVKGQ
jgi:hypothetical protein